MISPKSAVLMATMAMIGVELAGATHWQWLNKAPTEQMEALS
jgi:hypothetical protein